MESLLNYTSGVSVQITRGEELVQNLVGVWLVFAVVVLCLGLFGMFMLSAIEWMMGCIIDSYVAIATRLKRRRFPQKNKHRLPDMSSPDTPSHSAPSSDDETEKVEKV